jgi:hypothetical protein
MRLQQMPIWSCQEAHIMDLVHPVEDGGSQSSNSLCKKKMKKERDEEVQNQYLRGTDNLRG